MPDIRDDKEESLQKLADGLYGLMFQPSWSDLIKSVNKAGEDDA